MKHEYVDASDLIQTDMRSGNEKKLDAMLDERGANEMGAETAVVLRNIALELMAQLEQDEKTRPASDADMAVYHEISSNYNKDRSALAAQIHPRTERQAMNTTDKIMALADEYMRRPLVDSRDGSTTRNALRAEIEALSRENEALREKAAMHDAIQRACAELPLGADLHIELENGAGTVRLYLPDTDADITDFGSDLTFVQQINAAIDTAMQEKQS